MGENFLNSSMGCNEDCATEFCGGIELAIMRRLAAEFRGDQITSQAKCA